jgi:paraquat-inducible protein B
METTLPDQRSIDVDGAPSAGPDVRPLRSISPIWAVPIVALVIAAWLAYTSYRDQGPLIAITFRTASGIEPGKTHIKHHDIDLGVVVDVVPSPDLTQVIVHARMNATSADHLRKSTRFWVVRPRISLSGLSGLETLVSGAYIEMDPGDGDRTTNFTGLEEPPAVRADVPGTEFLLITERLGAVGPGSPLYFRGIDVGEVMGYSLGGEDMKITLRVFVRAPYDALVRERTRFWNASSIRLAAGGSGFKVEIESLQAVVAGAISFDTQKTEEAASPSKEGTTFRLYEDREQAQDAIFERGLKAVVEFGGSVRGLDVGAPVEFRGIKIGEVESFHPVFDLDTKEFRIPVVINLDIDRIAVHGGDQQSVGAGKFFPEFVARGLRAQLRSTSLITGQLAVALDFFPDAPPAKLETSDGMMKLPTLPNDLENITRSVNDTLGRIAALPLQDVVHDVRRVLASILTITDSPEVRDTVVSARNTLVQAEHVMRTIDGQVEPLTASLRKASDSADAALRQADATLASIKDGYGHQSGLNRDVGEMLRQLRDAARSVRQFADFLEQHPEALVRGKGGAQ